MSLRGKADGSQPPTAEGDPLLEPLAALLPTEVRRGSAVVTDAARRERAEHWRLRLDTDPHPALVVEVDAETTTESLSEQLVAHGSCDVLVVVLAPETVTRLFGSHRQLVRHTFAHVRPLGTFLLDVADDRGAHGREARLERMLRSVQESMDDTSPAEEETTGVLTVARAARELHDLGDVIAIRKRGKHAYAVGEGVPLSLISAREPDTSVTVLATRPGGVLDVRMHESSYGPSRAEPWPDALPYPPLELRRYEGTLLSLGGMRLISGTTVLPESFRWPDHRPLTHPHMRSVAPGFVRVPRRAGTSVLEGEHYFLDCVFDGHFGHLTTEVVCRLWGWDEAKRQIPDLKALVHVRAPGRGRLERMLLTAYGIDPEDIVVLDHPTRLRSVVGASPMWHNQDPHHAHPDIVDTWHRLTAGLLEDASPGPYERIFVSRGPGLGNRRPCRNQADLERFFADRGFHVFYPEDLPMSEQVALFAGARVVAGFGGSAMFNLMHCQHLAATIVISHHGYAARNEHLFTSLLGADIHYFWQTPEVAPPEHGRTRQSDRSGYTFDFAGQGADLERVIAQA